MLIPEPVRYRDKGARKPVLGKEGEKEVEVMYTKKREEKPLCEKEEKGEKIMKRKEE